MSKHNRDYEEETIETAKRIRKYPEHLRAARSSPAWLDYLLNVVNINPDTVSSERGAAFWEGVRNEIPAQETGFTTRRLIEARVEVVTGVYRDAKGRFTKEVTNRSVYSFRSTETGRFVSRQYIENA